MCVISPRLASRARATPPPRLARESTTNPWEIIQSPARRARRAIGHTACLCRASVNCIESLLQRARRPYGRGGAIPLRATPRHTPGAAGACISGLRLLAGACFACAGCASLIGLDQGVASAGDGSIEGGGPAANGSIEGGGPTADGSIEGGGSTADDAASPPASDVAVDRPVAPRESGPSDDGAPCPLTLCAGGCFDTNSDPAHCGSCSNACEAPSNGHAICMQGSCKISCENGYAACGGAPCACGPADVCLSSGQCGTCRAHLQSCAANGDCCSGTCLAAACL
jgi:hypothetical protein